MTRLRGNPGSTVYNEATGHRPMSLTSPGSGRCRRLQPRATQHREPQAWPPAPPHSRPHKERVTSLQCLQHVPPCCAERRCGPPRGPPPPSWPSAPSTRGPRELSVLWSLSLLRGIQNAAPGGGGSLAGSPGRTQDACERWPGADPGPHRGHAGAQGLTQPRIHLLTKTDREEPPETLHPPPGSGCAPGNNPVSSQSFRV